jgi:hypothetical protein
MSRTIEQSRKHIEAGFELIKQLDILLARDREQWKSVDGYDNYEVSNRSRVKNIDTGKILKRSIRNKYYGANLYNNDKMKTFKVHRLVAIAFVANPHDKPCVDHINNDKLDNNVTNLRWATFKENNQNKPKQSNNTSGVKGICWDKRSNKWRAHIQIDGIKVHLGYFDNLDNAKEARVEKANKAFGNYTNSSEKQLQR